MYFINPPFSNYGLNNLKEIYILNIAILDKKEIQMILKKIDM